MTDAEAIQQLECAVPMMGDFEDRRNARSAIAALAATIARLTTALGRYGNHIPHHCHKERFRQGPCTCGFAAALDPTQGFCNKCGYVGHISPNGEHAGCDYLAVKIDPTQGRGDVITKETKCCHGNCDKPSEFRGTWPGRDETGWCAKCADAALRVASAMGFYLQLIPLDNPTEQGMGA